MSAVVPRLEMRQGQSLVMTQQLQQSIKLLQLSSIELAEYINQELEKNPLLSQEEGEDPSRDETAKPEDGEKAEGDTSAEQADEPVETVEQSAVDDSLAVSATVEDAGYDTGSLEGAYEPRSGAASLNEESPDFESYTAEEVTLRDALLKQLNMEVADPVKRIIGQHLIDLVDEAGYIKDDTTGLAQMLGCDDQMIHETFAVLHTFDPPGVCARSLSECLAIQLRDKDRLDPAMQILLDHLDLLAKGDMDTLRKLCGVDAEDMREMCAEIRALNPRPGSGFQHEMVQAVVPDVFVRPAKIKGADGYGWQIELNSNVLPRVLVNRRYLTQISSQARDKGDKKYLSDQLTTANWLVKALDQRAHTIMKVSTEIVTQQDAFFRHGIRYLRPLTLREVAAAVDLHESTVSRVTTSKFMATPRGTYELKYFFNASLGNADGGEAFSNKTVQYLIKELIEKEAADAILSDDTIADRLKERGIDVARRTVAKYRELMHIPASSVRRREKKANP